MKKLLVTAMALATTLSAGTLSAFAANTDLSSNNCVAIESVAGETGVVSENPQYPTDVECGELPAGSAANYEVGYTGVGSGKEMTVECGATGVISENPQYPTDVESGELPAGSKAN